jgi:hypothetical protein
MKKYLNSFGLLNFMNIAMYTSRYGTIIRSTDKTENVTGKDVLDPKGLANPKSLEDQLNYTHMVLTTNSSNQDFTLEGFYRFGEKQSPNDVTLDDIKTNSSLKITNNEAVRLLNEYYKRNLVDYL